LPKSLRRPKENQTHHPEAKGLVFITLSILLFISLASFFERQPEENWLGIMGYYLAFSFHYIMGLGSYFIVTYLLWMGWHLIKVQNYKDVAIKTFYFSLFLSSICILCNLLAETHWLDLSFFYDKVYSETVVIGSPTIARYTRYNLGGVPFYYLYRDLPYVNMQHLLSDIGVAITFSLLSLVSFILLTDLSFFRGIHRVLEFFPYLYNVTISFLKMVLKATDPLFPKKPKREPIFATSISPPYKTPTSIMKKEVKEAVDIPIKRVHSDPFEESFVDLDPPPPVEKPRRISLQQPTKNRIAVAEFLEKQEKALVLQRVDELPPSSLLTDAKKGDQTGLKKELQRLAEILKETLASFGIEAKVGHIYSGPTITSFEVHPAIGVKVQKIKALENDIALNLQAKSIRIIAPIPGKAAVGVEIPSLYPQEVGFKEMLALYKKMETKHHIPMLLGKAVTGEDVFCDLTKMPHCIIAGATGAGKSVCINAIIMSILMNLSPDDVRLILIDPKKVELTPFSNLPHLIAPVITEPSGAYAALQWIVKQMQSRYEIFKQLGVRNIHAFNHRKIDKELEKSLDLDLPERMPFFVCIIDEFADLMMTSSTDLETPITRIAQMARAVGIHLILATQRPSREVITGLIKANFPTRIAFKVSSRVNSQIILDENGAETLLGNGDMLFLPPGTSQLIRCQGVFVRDEDITRVVDFICKRIPTNYLLDSFDKFSVDAASSEPEDRSQDLLYDKALQTVLENRVASTTFLQRKLKIGYARAASLIDSLEENGVIGPQDGSKPRRIIKSLYGDES